MSTQVPPSVPAPVVPPVGGRKARRMQLNRELAKRIYVLPEDYEREVQAWNGHVLREQDTGTDEE